MAFVTTIAAAGVFFAADPTFIPAHLGLDRQSWLYASLGLSLGLVFLLYVFNKEKNLRDLTSLLVEERVHSSALSTRLTELSRLSELGKAVNASLEADEVFNQILSSAMELLGGTRASILLLDSQGTDLDVVSYRGPAGERRAERVQVGEGLEGMVAKRRSPLRVTRPPEHAGGAGSSSMCVPLIRRNELLGVLSLEESLGTKEFTPGDLDALGVFAEYAAIAIANARVFEAERDTITRLEDLDQLKNDFVATVSHELRTPLTSIIGAARTLATKGAAMQPEQRSAFEEIIQRQADRLLRLVEDVLTASRVESGLPQLRRDLVDLAKLGQLVVEDMTHAKSGQGRTINLEVVPPTAKVWGDRVALEQILSNLIENALKYSENDTEVDVRLTETPAESIIEVTDHGYGIPADQLEQIFERFRQVDSSSTRSAGGFGLGLFIVKNLVNAHRGSVDVQSEEGVGTTFRIRLPKRAEQG